MQRHSITGAKSEPVAEKQPDLSTVRGVVLSIAAALIGAVLAVILGPGGIGLIVTGQAFITSCVAVVVYALIAPGFADSEAPT